MNITNTQKHGRVLVTILELAGKMDGSNYMSLVDEARKTYLNGIRDLLIDLSKLTFLSSAVLAALHKTALLFRGRLRVPKTYETAFPTTWRGKRFGHFRFRFPVRNTVLSEISENGKYLFGPAWSPDGTRIAFSMSPLGKASADIFTSRLDGSDRQQVTKTADNEIGIDWGIGGG
jgi:STAS domain/WD40-like Beta Propeller Repeat